MQFNRFRDSIELDSPKNPQPTHPNAGCCSDCRKCELPKSKLKTEETFNVNELSRIPVPNIDLSFFGTRVSLLAFLCRFTFDLFILFPYYILRTTVVGIYLTITELREGMPLLALKMFIIHLFDIIMPISVLGLISILSAYERDIFYEWALTCFILFISFILLTSYMSTSLEEENARKKRERLKKNTLSSQQSLEMNVEEEEPKSWLQKLNSLLDAKHMQKLGLGRLQQMFLTVNASPSELPMGAKSGVERFRKIFEKDVHKKFDSYFELLGEIKRLFDQLNIDPTFLYYSNFYDNTEKERKYADDDEEQDDMVQSEFDHLTQLNLMPRKRTTSNKVSPGRARRASCWDRLANEMHPALQESHIYTKRKGVTLLWKLYSHAIKATDKSQADLILESLAMLLIVSVKIILPFGYVVGANHAEKVKIFPLLVITDFYLYLLLLLWQIIDNNDLKLRAYLLKGMTAMVSFDEHKDYNKKLDFTCPLSLETWDNCRRVACALNEEKTKKYEIIYLFLGFYFFFLFLILIQIWTKTYFFLSKETIYEKPILLLTMTIDFILLVIVFLSRIYHGDQFNKCFIEQTNALKRMKGIYEDLLQLRNIYFNEKVCIQNEVYNAVVESVQHKWERRELEMVEREHGKAGVDEGKSLPKVTLRDAKLKFILIYMKDLRGTASKIIEQVSVDEKHLRHQFLTILPSDFHTITAQFLVATLPFIPGLINGLVAIF